MNIPLYDYLTQFTGAANPIEPDVFNKVPFFEELFEKKLWPKLVRLSGDSGIAFIEIKTINPGDSLIKKGDFDMMIYWIIEGGVDVVIPINGKNTIVKKYNNIGDCFGELAIIEEKERIANVVASNKTGATILEVDWSITNVCREINAKFTKLLLKTVANKLIDNYEVSNSAFLLLKKLRTDSIEQKREIEKLKSLLIKNKIPLV